MDDAAVSPGLDGRTEGGRFAPGNKLAKGNPNARRMHALRTALLEAVGDDTIRQVGEQLAEKARAGDLDAIKVLLDYCVGKAPAALDVSLGDGDGPGANVVFATILATLAPYPEARVEVAARLRALAGPAEADD